MRSDSNTKTDRLPLSSAWRGRKGSKNPQSDRFRRRLLIESLEDRRLLTTFNVTPLTSINNGLAIPISSDGYYQTNVGVERIDIGVVAYRPSQAGNGATNVLPSEDTVYRDSQAGLALLQRTESILVDGSGRNVTEIYSLTPGSDPLTQYIAPSAVGFVTESVFSPLPGGSSPAAGGANLYYTHNDPYALFEPLRLERFDFSTDQTSSVGALTTNEFVRVGDFSGLTFHNNQLYYFATATNYSPDAYDEQKGYDYVKGLFVLGQDGKSGLVASLETRDGAYQGNHFSVGGKPVSTSVGLLWWGDDGVRGMEPYIGGNLLKDINLGAASSGFGSTEFWDVGGTVYFRANDGVRGYELWKTNGAGAELVADINPGIASSFPVGSSHSSLNGQFVFSADDGIRGQELWTTDNSPARAHLIRDLNPGPAPGVGTTSYGSLDLYALGGSVLFAGNNGAIGEGSAGVELWQTDGTSFGTSLVADLNPTGSSNPYRFSKVNNDLFFWAFTDTTRHYTVSVGNQLLPEITVTTIQGSATEGSTDNLVFQVSRTGSTATALPLNLSLTGAASASDYVITNPAGFAIGESSFDILVAPIDDNEAEPAESVVINILNGASYFPSSTPFAFGFINSVSTPLFDFGDAPTSYGTLTASHVATGARLGALRDTEASGQPSASADGDDLNGVSDEDGVVFTTLVPGQGATANVTIIGIAGNATHYLSGWIDFNRDGDFEDANEKVIGGTTGSAVTSDGSFARSFLVPADVGFGPVFARFRLSTTSGLSATGAAPDGEVEDYALTIVATTAPPADIGLTNNVIVENSPPNNVVGSLFVPDPILGSPRSGSFVYTLVSGNGGNHNAAFLINGNQLILTASPDFETQSLYAVRIRSTDSIGQSFDKPLLVYVTNIEEADFGDAPAPYPTTFAQNGARHEAIGPQLGATRDINADGQPSANATGDGADEDGVTFGVLNVGQLAGSVTVSVGNAPTGARLDAWIDFNHDGTWGGPSEQIFESKTVINGDNLLTFSIPSYALVGQTFARFRLSAAGNLGVRGFADDGEVEDYSLTLSPAKSAEGTGTFLPAATIPGLFPSVSTVYAADLDGDGDLDSLTASFGNGQIAWQANNVLLGTFTAQTLIDTFAGATSAIAADVNGDGRLDVVATSYSTNSVAWYKNLGGGSFGSRTIIDGNATFVAKVFAADIDADGDIDLVSASIGNGFAGGVIKLYVNNGQSNPGFATIIVRNGLNAAYDVTAADVDHDGDMDILSASLGDNSIYWYENNGSLGFSSRLVTNQAIGAHRVLAVDLDQDGDIDIISSSIIDNRITWYENNGLQNFNPNIVHNIDTSATGVRSIEVADLDGDGDLDVLASLFGADRFVWYRNNGFQTYSRQTIAASISGAHSAVAADFDGDGDLDVLTGAYFAEVVRWYENVGVVLSPNTFGLDENTSVPTDRLMSVISITNDGQVIDTLSLSGPDAASFKLIGTQLFLKAGAVLDYETKSSYVVRVNVDNLTLGSVPKAFADFTLTVRDLVELETIDVQNGQTQRSFVRNLDLIFASATGVADLVANANNRIKLTRFDLNGLNGSVLAVAPTASGNDLNFDFGAQGIGGNRNSNAGDGYYQIALDLDGNGSFETVKSFFRLFGDVTGDGIVDGADKKRVLDFQRTTSAEADVNGDGSVNATDTSLVVRAIGKKLKAGLWVDD